MSKTRKPLEMQKGNLTQEIQIKKEQEERAVTVGRDALINAPPWLINDTARAEYTRLVGEFDKINIIGNLDLNNLGGYCNAYALYLEATNQLKPSELIVVKYLPNGAKQNVENPLIKIQKNYSDEMRKFGAKVGLDIDSRLKCGSNLVGEKETEVVKEFGDI